MTQTIGLLGGSFNPAHSGHVHISREALKRLGLTEVWWLVSPRNPLKTAEGMGAYEERVAQACTLTAHERGIHVSTFEAQAGTRYTVDTLAALAKRYPRVRFVWLMGADNLAQLHRWKRWEEIMQSIPVVVFDRSPYSHRALHAKAALRFAAFRMYGNTLHGMAETAPPSWAYLTIRRDTTSATAIRQQKMLGK